MKGLKRALLCFVVGYLVFSHANAAVVAPSDYDSDEYTMLKVADRGYFPRMNNFGEIVYYDGRRIVSTRRGVIVDQPTDLEPWESYYLAGDADINDSGEVIHRDARAPTYGWRIVSTTRGVLQTWSTASPPFNLLNDGDIGYYDEHAGAREIKTLYRGTVVDNLPIVFPSRVFLSFNNNGDFIYTLAGNLYDDQENLLVKGVGMHAAINDLGDIAYATIGVDGVQIYQGPRLGRFLNDADVFDFNSFGDILTRRNFEVVLLTQRPEFFAADGFAPVPVPVPATLPLFATAVAGIALLGRRVWKPPYRQT